MDLPIYFDFDLLKAKRDTSKLVKVQRSVTRGGKTFMQDFWVKPGDVKKTDIVIGGQQNLIPDLSKIQAPAKGTWDKSYFDALSKQTDKSLMLNYLKDCGVTWTESTNKGINLMRALMSAQSKGLLPKKTANSSQTSTNNSSANQAVPANGTNSVPKDLSSVMTDLQALSSSKEKVQFLKKKWGIQKLLDFATNAGVTWNVNANDGINKMRMQMALKAYFDTLDWGTTGKVGAPLGNQNAKKDTVVQAPPVDPNKIVVPNDANKRIKNLIELINEISDKPTLELIGKSGIVPEDDLSKSFLEQKLWKEYSQKLSNASKNSYSSSSNYWLFNSGDKELVKSRVDFLSKGFKGFSKIQLRQLSKKLRVFSPNSELEILYPRNTLQCGYGIYSEFFDSTREHDLNLMYFLEDLKKFSQYSDVDNPTSTFTDNIGNIWKTDGAYYVDGIADFDIQKEGIKVLLDYISSQQPELKDSCKKLEERYKNLMLKVDNNLNYLNYFALDNTSNEWKRLNRVKESWNNLEQGMPEFYKAWKDQGFTDEELKTTMEIYAKCLLSSDYPGGRSIIYDAGTKAWNNQDFGWAPHEQKQIRDLLTYINYGKKLPVFDKNGQPLKDANGELKTFTYGFNIQNPLLISYYGKSQLTFDSLLGEAKYSGNISFSSDVISLLYMYDKDHPIFKNLNLIASESMLQLKRKIKERDFCNHIDAVKYCEIADELLKLFGLKVVDKQTLVELPSHNYINLSYTDEYITIPDNDDINLDATLGNLVNLIKADNLANRLLVFAKQHPDSSKNNNGEDYSRYFDYQTKSKDYSSRNSMTETGLSTYTEGPKWYSSDHDKFKNYDVNQLQQFKVYPPSFFKDAREYYDDNGDSNVGYYNNSSEKSNKVVSLCVDAPDRLNDSSFKSPMKNVFIDTLTSLAKFCPNNYTKNPSKNQKYFDDFMSDQKFVFPSSSKSQTIMLPDNELLDLRKKAFKNAKCSLSHVTGQNKTDVEHKVKLDFDRVDPNTGKRVWKGDRVYDNRTMVFHDVYEIKNSNMEDDFKLEADKLNETPVTRYHGTSYTGACGIMGVDGRFRYKHTDKLPGQKSSGTMLGQGIYTAKLVGKTLPYIGNSPYTYNHYTASDITTPSNEADGVLLVMDTLLGKYGEFNSSMDAKKNNKNEGGTYDSVAVGAGGLMPGGSTLLEYEAIVTRNNMLLPKYMVDCGGRRR